MKGYLIAAVLIFVAGVCACGKESVVNKNLNPQERAVIFGKATETPFTGKFDKFFKDGIYVCKNCSAPLYRSDDKFDSGCGWPAFDDAFPQAVKEIPDADGRRTEIVCARCGGHLGHVFRGESLTRKNTRHCVNSVSMDFIPAANLSTAVVAGGCFWGVEELMKNLSGVVACVSGYTGGKLQDPNYKQVCSGDTGHYEAVEIIFDNKKVSYEDVLKRFFEIHDLSQTDGQGNDIGSQYESAVFCSTPQEREVAEKLISLLRSKGYFVATKVLPATAFYSAEDYHQRYYERTKKHPYCHSYKKVF